MIWKKRLLHNAEFTNKSKLFLIKVSEYQAYRIRDLNPRNKDKTAEKIRQEIRSEKNVDKKMAKYRAQVNLLDHVAVKTLKGWF